MGRATGVGCVVDVLVVEGERLVVVVDLRQMRVGEVLGKDGQSAALFWHIFRSSCASSRRASAPGFPNP